MRKLIVVLALSLVAVAVIAAVAAGNLNSYLNENKDWIAKQIETSLARPVAFDAVGLSFNRGLAVEISGFRVGEDEGFGEGEFLSVGRTFVRVALWPALFGRVEVSKVSLRDVSMTVIQTATGLSIDSLGASSETPQPGPPATADTGPVAGADAITIAMAEIRSGTFRYIDRTGDPQREVVIDQLEFWTSDLQLARSIEFQIVGEVLGGGDANLRIHGQFGPISDLGSGSGGEDIRAAIPLDVNFSLGPVDAAALQTLPGLAGVIDPSLSLGGSVTLSGSVAGNTNTPNLKIEFDATDALVRYGEDSQKERGTALRLSIDLALAGQNLEINALDLEVEKVKLHAQGSISNLEDPTVDLTIDVFGGTIDVEGGWQRDGRLRLDTRVIDIDLGEMSRSLAQTSARIFDGRLNMSLKVTGTGETWAEIKPGLEGQGTAQIDSGILHDVNLIEEAVGSLSGVPGLSSVLPEKIRKKYPGLFSTGDTKFERMDAKVEIREGRVQILGIRLEAKDYGLRGWGSLSLDGDLDLSTRLALSTDLTKDLIDKAHPLKHLRDDRNRIVIPIRISGALPEVSAKADSDAIAKKLGSGAAESLAKKSLKKLIKKRRKKGDAAASMDTGRDLLERLLR